MIQKIKKILTLSTILISGIALTAFVFIIPGAIRVLAADCADAKQLKDNCIIKDINSIVNFLSIGIGVIIVIMIIVGGIQYSIAGDNPNAVTAAKQRLINAFIALAAFMLTFALLQWLVPGGVF